MIIDTKGSPIALHGIVDHLGRLNINTLCFTEDEAWEQLGIKPSPVTLKDPEGRYCVQFRLERNNQSA